MQCIESGEEGEGEEKGEGQEEGEGGEQDPAHDPTGIATGGWKEAAVSAASELRESMEASADTCELPTDLIGAEDACTMSTRKVNIPAFVCFPVFADPVLKSHTYMYMYIAAVQYLPIDALLTCSTACLYGPML